MALLLFAACGTVAGPQPPDWLETLPLEDGYIYGIGSYIGSLYEDDNLKNATDQARMMLARNLRSAIAQRTVVRNTETTSQIRSIAEVDSDYVVQNSETIAMWRDVDGIRSERGTIWVLMRIAKL